MLSLDGLLLGERCIRCQGLTGTMGAKDALDNAVIDLDIGKIRSEIGAVSGIGEKRLEQIMEIIQRNIAEAGSKDANAESVK